MVLVEMMVQMVVLVERREKDGTGAAVGGADGANGAGGSGGADDGADGAGGSGGADDGADGTGAAVGGLGLVNKELRSEKVEKVERTKGSIRDRMVQMVEIKQVHQ